LLTFADLLTPSEFDQSRGKSGSSSPSTTSWPSQLSPLFKLQSAPMLKSCDRQRKQRNPRITPHLKVAMPPVSGAGLPEPNLVPLPLLSDAVYKVRSRGGSEVQVLVVLDAPELQSSVWNCTGRPRALRATTVAVTYSIPGIVCWTIQQNHGDVEVRHFDASESAWPLTRHIHGESSVIPSVPGR
jgi:hypothetical protein